MKITFQGDPTHVRQVLVMNLIGVFGSIPLLAYFWEWKYAWFILGFYSFFLFVSHHAGLHRYFSHRSYSVNKFWHIFLCISSCLACFGSPAGYSIIHRAHHAHTDTDKDPHSPKTLDLRAVLFFRWNLDHLSMWDGIKDLRDPWIKFTHNYYVMIINVYLIILFFIDPMLILCSNVGVVSALLAMGYINTVCHSGGAFTYKNHKTKDSSLNSYLAIFIGEWHNNHHAKPRKWNQREKWWEIDYAAQFIRIIKK